MWPAIVVTLENTLLFGVIKLKLRTKITRFLKQLKDYQTLCNTCTYLDVLEKMWPVALIFEDENLLPFEVNEAIEIKQCLLKLKIYLNALDEMFDSHFNRFLFNEDKNGNQT